MCFGRGFFASIPHFRNECSLEAPCRLYFIIHRSEPYNAYITGLLSISRPYEAVSTVPAYEETARGIPQGAELTKKKESSFTLEKRGVRGGIGVEIQRNARPCGLALEEAVVVFLENLL